MCDVSDTQEMEKVFTNLMNIHRDVDVLVNAAGMMGPIPSCFGVV